MKSIANLFGLNAGGSSHMAIMSFKDKSDLSKALNLGSEIIQEKVKNHDK